MAQPVLETARLFLRDVQTSDADAFLSYMQRKEYWHSLPIEPPTAGSIAAMLNQCLLDQARKPRTDFLLAAAEKASGQIVGEAILHVRSTRWRQGEIGWGVGSSHAGRGFATEIGEAMLRFGFQTLGLHRIYAQCRIENLTSRRIMSKLGMREEGIMRENVLARGSWWSSVQCSILSTELDGQESVQDA